MNIFEKLQDFQSQPLSLICFNMVKWFEYDSVDISIKERQNVESGVWISVKIVKLGKTCRVDGQQIDIVKFRLIKFLNKNIN